MNPSNIIRLPVPPSLVSSSSNNNNPTNGNSGAINGNGLTPQQNNKQLSNVDLLTSMMMMAAANNQNNSSNPNNQQQQQQPNAANTAATFLDAMAYLQSTMNSNNNNNNTSTTPTANNNSPATLGGGGQGGTPPASNTANTTTIVEGGTEPASTNGDGSGKRVLRCPNPTCGKIYNHPNSLRYHLTRTDCRVYYTGRGRGGIRSQQEQLQQLQQQQQQQQESMYSLMDETPGGPGAYMYHPPTPQLQPHDLHPNFSDPMHQMLLQQQPNHLAQHQLLLHSSHPHPPSTQQQSTAVSNINTTSSSTTSSSLAPPPLHPIHPNAPLTDSQFTPLPSTGPSDHYNPPELHHYAPSMMPIQQHPTPGNPGHHAVGGAGGSFGSPMTPHHHMGAAPGGVVSLGGGFAVNGAGGMGMGDDGSSGIDVDEFGMVRGGHHIAALPPRPGVMPGMPGGMVAGGMSTPIQAKERAPPSHVIRSASTLSSLAPGSGLRYVCKVCGKVYKNLGGIKYHHKVVHPELDLQRDVKEVIDA